MKLKKIVAVMLAFMMLTSGFAESLAETAGNGGSPAADQTTQSIPEKALTETAEPTVEPAERTAEPIETSTPEPKAIATPTTEPESTETPIPEPDVTATPTAEVTETPIPGSDVTETPTTEPTETPTPEPDATEVPSVEVDPAAISLHVGETYTLRGAAVPESTVQWSSSEESVATVNENGMVTGIAAGTAVITCASEYAQSVCNVTVWNGIGTISVQSAEDTLYIGETLQLTADYTAENEEVPEITWSVDDSRIASVDAQTGLLTPIHSGSVNVTVTAANGSANTADTVTITILCELGSLEITDDRTEAFTGDSFSLSYEYTQAHGEKPEITWSVDDDTIADIDSETGGITALAYGTVTVTLTAELEDKTVSASKTIRIRQTLGGIAFADDITEMFTGKTAQLTAEYTPAADEVPEITYEVDDEDCAAVNAGTGLLSAVAYGTVTVTVTASLHGESVSAEKTVRVRQSMGTLTIGGHEATLPAPQTMQLSYTYTPADNEEPDITWDVSDEHFAEIDAATGLLTAKNPGDVTVTVTAELNEETVSASFVLTVLRYPESVSIEPETLVLRKGERSTLTGTILPADVTETYAWASSDESVATVDPDGTVTALKPGKTRITLTCHDKTAECALTVIVEPDSLEFINTHLTLQPAQTGKVYTAFTPEDVTEKALTWTTSAPSVATVKNGTVTAVAVGTCVITAETVNGIKCSFTVNVVKKGKAVTTFKLSKTSASVTHYSTLKLTASQSPSAAVDKELLWLTSDPSVVTVKDGVVTAVNVGKATITAICSNGKAIECKITVNPLAVKSLKLNASKATLFYDDDYQLTATVTPANADNAKITWKSSNQKVATVDENGRVKAVGSGTATITASVANGKKATFNVTVKGITVKLDAAKGTLKLGGTLTLIPTLSSDVAEWQSIKWTSSKISAATVDGNGKVTAVGGGTVTITATTVSGDKATFKLTISPASVTLNRTSLTMEYGGSGKLSAVVSNVDPSADDTFRTVKWKSSNSSVVTVDENGNLKAVGGGTATVTATSGTGNTASCKVTVKHLPLELDATALSMDYADTELLVAKVDTDQDDWKDVTWVCKNTSVATVQPYSVDKNGYAKAKVTAVGGGSTTITVTNASGKTVTCQVTCSHVNVKLDYSSGHLTAGEEFPLGAHCTVSPKKYKTVTWTSSDTSIATVNDEGLIKGVGMGTVNITATSVSGMKAVCKVTVYPRKITELRLENPNDKLYAGGSYQLLAVCKPDKATVQSYTWKTSSRSIATVDSNGVVKCLKKGTVTITATAKDGSGKKASIKLTIQSIAGDCLTLPVTAVTLKAGERIKVSASANGVLSGEKITWKSANDLIATVGEDGTILAIGSGKTTVTATAKGISRSVSVTVEKSSDTNYRVLIAGEYMKETDSGYLKFAANGLTGVAEVFEQANMDGDRYEIKKLTDPSESKLVSEIAGFFSGAKEGDVSVLYLLSHGQNVNGEYRWQISGSSAYITEKELTQVIERIDGNVLLVLCSCYAGEYLNDYTDDGEETSINNVISTVNGTRGGSAPISVITANSGKYLSAYTEDRSAENAYDFFTQAFTAALGYDLTTQKDTGKLQADSNKDGKVTVLELAKYVCTKVVSSIKSYLSAHGASAIHGNTAQTPQYYVTTPDLVVYER